MSAEENAKNVNDIESLLSNLAPLRPQLERDRLMFLAGQDAAFRSPRRFVRFAWPASLAAMTVVALGVGGWGFLQHKQAELAVWRLNAVQMSMATPAPVRPTWAPAAVPAPGGGMAGAGMALLGGVDDVTLEPWEQEAVASAERAEALKLASKPAPWKQRARRTDGRGPANTDYVHLRDQILAFGVEGVPGEASRSGGTAATSSAYLELLKGNVGNW